MYCFPYTVRVATSRIPGRLPARARAQVLGARQNEYVGFLVINRNRGRPLSVLRLTPLIASDQPKTAGAIGGPGIDTYMQALSPDKRQAQAKLVMLVRGKKVGAA